MLRQTFDYLLGFKKRTVTFKRLSSSFSATIVIHPSNTKMQNTESIGNTVVKGQEFIITQTELTRVAFVGQPKRGDRIVDADQGELTLDYSFPLYDVGGAIMGYRVGTA